MIPSKLIATIEQGETFFLFAHTRPDGDALGSLFGCAEILRSLGKQVYCCLERPLPASFHFLPVVAEGLLVGYEQVAAQHRLHPEAVAVALDCGDSGRLGELEELFLSVADSAVLDHHKSHVDFGNCRWVAPGLSSTGEMLVELAEAMEVPLCYDGAYSLYVAIVTDTGGFRYESTTPRTHQIAGKLLELGVKPAEVGSKLYDTWTPSRLQLMNRVLATMQLDCEQQLASIYVEQSMLADSDATLEETEGLVDYPRSLLGVKVAFFIKESEDGSYSVSMRAKGECDVAVVAEQFGGGGHRNAAGFRSTAPSVEQVRSEVVAALSVALS